MEFETNTIDKPSGVSDDQRLAASTKRVTIAPLHAIAEEEPVIRPREDVPADIQVSQGNVYIASESEDTSTAQTDTSQAAAAAMPAQPRTHTGIVAAIILFVAASSAVIYFLVR